MNSSNPPPSSARQQRPYSTQTSGRVLCSTADATHRGPGVRGPPGSNASTPPGVTVDGPPPESVTSGGVGSASAATVRRCTGCGQNILDRFLLHAMDCYWHVGCLRCSTCQSPLDEVVATCYSRAGLILCKKDYIRLFGATGTCASCRQTIPAGQFVMKARGDAYHVTCFNCVVCRSRLVPGDRYALVNGALVCERDYPKVTAVASAGNLARTTGTTCSVPMDT